MAGSWFAKDFAWMARSPSHRAPRLSDLGEPCPVRGRVAMSATERELLDAVLAEPDADAPRLRYAEWCDRQGDPRGAFIREQLRTLFSCSLPPCGGGLGWGVKLPPKERSSPLGEALTPHPNPPPQGGREQNQDTLAQHMMRWGDVFAPWSARDLVFRRGFVEAMSLAGRAFISLGEPLFRLTPLREVRLVAISPFLDELAQTPHLAKLHALDLRGNALSDADVELLRKQWPALVLLR